MTSSSTHKVDKDNVLRTIDINNSEILGYLQEWSDWITENVDDISSLMHHSIREPSPGYGISDEYRKEVISDGHKHDGFPYYERLYNIRPDFLRYRPTNEKAAALAKELKDRYHKMNDAMVTTLGIRRNALSALYVKDGYIGWHNNANASSYNLIFTYSSEGKGYWEHVNPYDKAVERIDDVQGWQCKASYFGAYQENDPTTLVYHSATCTGGFRLTVSWIFDRENKDWWEDSLEEIADA